LRKNTPKRAASNRESDKLRKQFLEDNPHCFICGSDEVQCHEICRGCSRAKSLLQPRNYLALCHSCHGIIHERTNWWDTEMQVALKWLNSSWTMEEIVVAVNHLNVRQITVADVKLRMRMI